MLVIFGEVGPMISRMYGPVNGSLTKLKKNAVTEQLARSILEKVVR